MNSFLSCIKNNFLSDKVHVFFFFFHFIEKDKLIQTVLFDHRKTWEVKLTNDSPELKNYQSQPKVREVYASRIKIHNKP